MTKKKSKVKRNSQKLERVEKSIRNGAVQFLRKNPNRSFNHKQIAAGIDIRGQVSHEHFQTILQTLVEKDKIEDKGRGKYQIKIYDKVVTGKLDVTRDGYGFLVVEGEDKQDIFIPARYLGKAFHGDIVKVRITKFRGSGGRPEGEVLEVVERSRSVFIGTVDEIDGTIYFEADDPKLDTKFMVQGDLLDAKFGDKLLFEVDDWDNFVPMGHITKILGPAGENDTEMHAILFQFGFQTAFPAEVEAEAEKIPAEISKNEISNRRDMRGTDTFTIDPHDAKDFDDALSFKKLDNGHFEIGVHIADVSHYVRPGTRLDQEARHRATSVYLVDRTVPMLPERLSNNLCSLRPHEDKLTFSAVFEVDEEGKIYSEWFGKTVIHSDRRFTYEEAQVIIEAGEGQFAEELAVVNKIAKLYQATRFKQGSINFEEDEVKFELDDEGHPIRVYRKVRKDAHKMIEDWMLLANRRVSEFVYRMRKDPPLPSIYRVHDTPDQEKLVTLRNFVANLGYELQLDDTKQVSKSLNQLMSNVIGKPEQGMVQQIAVRTMAKAVYTTKNIGHYGLGFDYYSHFTSPIRRYPDLLFHRLLAKYQGGNLSGTSEALETTAKHCSNQEKRAVEAERASIKLKQVEFLEDKVGQEFEGIVSGVAKWGIYVELIENRCEGMVGLHDMEGDFYEVDQEQFCVRGRSSGDVIRLGDKIMIEVKGTSTRNRNIDFLLVEVLESSVSPELQTVFAAADAAKQAAERKSFHKKRSGKPKGKGAGRNKNKYKSKHKRR